LCSIGNGWMKIHNLGRYAVSLFDKYTGEGVRVSIDPVKLAAFPEIESWFLKKKPKADQDEERLVWEIETAGDSYCKVEKVTVKRRFLGHSHMEGIGLCSQCGEAYPTGDGPICRGCQGEAPYVTAGRIAKIDTPPVRIVPAEEAVGKQAAHDMTRIDPGMFKGPEFKAGQRISVGDICRLQQMGRFHVAVQDDGLPEGLVHENDVAESFAGRMAGPGVSYKLPPQEGKIDFTADRDGLLCVDTERMRCFNMVPEIMVASRQDATMVSQGDKLAGTRAIPLYINRERLGEALHVLGTEPLFQVLPLRQAKVGILVTGTEVFQGIIEDKFIPVITAKAKQYHCTVVQSVIVPDDKEAIAEAVATISAAGADLLVTTGGLSVDPEDVTRQALIDAGLTDVLHGVPVLPGAMSLMGKLPGSAGDIQVLGVPACALYFKTTFFDLILPRMLAGREITRAELARMGDGGYCLGCKTCTYPKCQFGK
jgi:formylmethanofuran dehydrogenase subunit E